MRQQPRFIWTPRAPISSLICRAPIHAEPAPGGVLPSDTTSMCDDDASEEDHGSDDPEELGELDEPCDAVGGPTHTFSTFDSVGGTALWVKLEEEIAARRGGR
jgi:hypothetical protein